MAKVEQETIDNIRFLQEQMKTIQLEIGAIALMKNREQELLDAYNEADAKMVAIRKSLLEQYGDGTLHLDKGEFEPAESPDAEVVE